MQRAGDTRTSEEPHIDPLRSGESTPWEDRGGRGLIGAFCATCIGGIVHPGRLSTSIRRPETTTDATSFALGCGLLWGIAWAINSSIYYFIKIRNPEIDPNGQLYIVGTVLQTACAVPCLWLVLRLVTNLFRKLIASEARFRFPRALIYNIFAYCLGPSLLALIPFLGIPLAVIWIACTMIAVAGSRLRLPTKTAIICTIIAVGAGLIIFIAAYFAVWLAWSQIFGGTLVLVEHTSTPTNP